MTTTATTATSAMTSKVFDSVELVLMLLSMYSCVTRDVRTTVLFLLEIVFGYEPVTRRFGRIPTIHEVTTLFEPLSALARFHDAKYKLEYIRTETHALEMVVSILRPILIRLTPAEFAEIHKRADDAVEIMIYTPLSEVQDMAAQWAADARSNAKLHNWLEWSRVYMPAGESDIKPVDVPKAGAIVAQYLYGESAAAPATCSLRRVERVEKRRREDDPGLDSEPRKRQALRDPLPARPCPVRVMVTSPTVPDISGSSNSLDSLAMDRQPFIPSHRGVRSGAGEWTERDAPDGFKFPAKAMDMDEPAGILDTSDDRSTTLDSEIADEETTAIPISRTCPKLSTSTSISALKPDLQRSQSAPQLTYAPRTRSPSELAASGTLATLSSLTPTQVASAHWRAFSISSGLSERTDSDISDWSLRMQWLEHEDDSFAMSRGGSVANLSDISYESFRFPRPSSSNGSSSPSTPSTSTSASSTPTRSTPTTSLESLFEGWADSWQMDQLAHWKCGICEHDACESEQQTLAAQYSEWADEWDASEVEWWTNALADQEVEVCLDRKTRRVEIRQPGDSTMVNLARKIGRVFGL